MTEQNEGSSKTANKAAKEFAKYSSPEYKQEAAGEFGGATVPTGYVAPNKLDEKTAQKYSGGQVGKNFNQEAAQEISGTQQAKPLYTVPGPNKNASPVGYAGTMGGATPANRMTQETATELNPATKGNKNSKKTK